MSSHPTLNDMYVSIRALIGDPSGDGLKTTEIRDIINMVYQSYHGQYGVITTAYQKNASNADITTALGKMDVDVDFPATSTIKNILRVEIVPVQSESLNKVLEKVEFSEIMERSSRGNESSQPTSWYAYRHDDAHNRWVVLYHPKSDAGYKLKIWVEENPIDLAATTDVAQVTDAEAIAIMYIAAYHCAILHGKHDRLERILALIPEHDKARFNVRTSMNKPKEDPVRTSA